MMKGINRGKIHAMYENVNLQKSVFLFLINLRI